LNELIKIQIDEIKLCYKWMNGYEIKGIIDNREEKKQ